LLARPVTLILFFSEINVLLLYFLLLYLFFQSVNELLFCTLSRERGCKDKGFIFSKPNIFEKKD
ncbi:MAG: hypothetical protein WC262_02335, partial [Bacteroidales bacterium]